MGPFSKSAYALHFEIDQISMKALRGYDTIRWESYESIYSDRTHISMNYTPITSGRYNIELLRKVPLTDLGYLKLNTMPGFKLTWYYSGMNVESKGQYYRDPNTKAFVRKDSIEYSIFNAKIMERAWVGYEHMSIIYIQRPLFLKTFTLLLKSKR